MEKLKELLDNLKQEEKTIMYELERLRDVHAHHLIPTHEFLDKTATLLGRLQENGRVSNVVRDMIIKELRENE